MEKEKMGNPKTDKIRTSFTYWEALYIVNALNGVICRDETFVANILVFWGFSNHTENINYDEFKAKLNSMSAEDIALYHEAVTNFWFLDADRCDPETFLSFGLIKSGTLIPEGM